MAELAPRLEPVARALLEPGEELLGCCVATWQKTFTGGMYAVAVAPTRIALQKLDRRFSPTGNPLSLPPDRIARATVENGIGGEWSVPGIILDMVAISVLLTTTDGEKLKLMLMGSGGEIQTIGITALLAYLEPLVETTS